LNARYAQMWQLQQSRADSPDASTDPVGEPGRVAAPA
jgi:hypothetical protein